MKLLSVSHTGIVGGGERSLIELLGGLPPHIPAYLACPRIGPLAPAAESTGAKIMPIPDVDVSLRLHPLHTPKGIGQLGIASLATAAHATRIRADLLYANSVRAGLLAMPAARLARVPLVTHVRDRLPRSRVADSCLSAIATAASVVVANSTYTADGVRAVTAKGRLEIVHSPVDLARFDRSRVDRETVREELGLEPERLVLAVIAQITPWKGQLEAVRALSALRDRGIDARLLLVGEAKFISRATRFDNRGYLEALRREIADRALSNCVLLLGERSDVPAVMSALDVLLVPSPEEPFGRVVIEAMALGIPVIATNRGGPAEIITDGVDGLLREPNRPQEWANAIAQLAADPQLRARLGAAGVLKAQAFSLPSHIDAMLRIFEDAAGRT